ncbi:uncharacterized protein ACBT44_007539 isoform 2-T6 [Syngnathus typhle]
MKTRREKRREDTIADDKRFMMKTKVVLMESKKMVRLPGVGFNHRVGSSQASAEAAGSSTSCCQPNKHDLLVTPERCQLWEVKVSKTFQQKHCTTGPILQEHVAFKQTESGSFDWP